MNPPSAAALPAYVGRFAPTPSGPLHLGSLLTALAGWLQARAAGGHWLIRIDDLDRPRCPPGTDTLILRQLEQHGLHWDDSPRYQSAHQAEYREALEALAQAGHLYACDCTRARLLATSRPGPDDPVYDGHCRDRQLPVPGQALRLRCGPGPVSLDDPWQGLQHRDLATEIGDFIVWRRDGIAGYPLACVVDDAAQGITEIVRGADLLGSTLRQRHLMSLRGQALPAARHLPVLVGADGRKLSKQNHARALDPEQAGANLWRCLAWLDQDPPPGLQGAASAELLAWALAHWKPGRLRARLRLEVEQAP